MKSTTFLSVFEVRVGSERAPCRVDFEKRCCFLHKMAWMLSMVAVMIRMGTPSESTKIWRDALDQWTTAVLVVFMTIQEAELDHAG